MDVDRFLLLKLGQCHCLVKVDICNTRISDHWLVSEGGGTSERALIPGRSFAIFLHLSLVLSMSRSAVPSSMRSTVSAPSLAAAVADDLWKQCPVKDSGLSSLSSLAIIFPMPASACFPITALP